MQIKIKPTSTTLRTKKKKKIWQPSKNILFYGLFLINIIIYLEVRLK